MKVMVTGGSGFLGGHVIPALVERGDDVFALARSEAAADRVEALGATAIRGDLDDPSALKQAFAADGADVLINLASLGFGHAPAIVAAAEEAGIRRAVFVSTTGIFTALEPRTKATRVAAEELIRSSQLEWTIIRPTMIYGTPRDRNMWRLLQLLRRSPVVPLPGGGRRLQQPVHVDDLAQAILAASTAPAAVGRAYDVAGPDAISLRQVVTEAARAVGKRPYLVPVPISPLVAGLHLYERLTPRPRVKAEQVLRLAEDKAFDIGPAQRDLGYQPRSFENGIRAEAGMRRV